LICCEQPHVAKDDPPGQPHVALDNPLDRPLDGPLGRLHVALDNPLDRPLHGPLGRLHVAELAPRAQARPFSLVLVCFLLARQGRRRRVQDS
jgi:hypothetical protein